MIPVRIQVRLEALTDQYFPGLAVHALRPCSFDSDTFDVYELEMEDGRTYWLFDDQQTLWPLAKSGIYEDASNRCARTHRNCRQMLFRTAASFINNIKRTLCHPVSCGWLFLCPAVSICVLSFLLKWRMRQTSSQTSSLRSSCSNIHKKRRRSLRPDNDRFTGNEEHRPR